MHSLSMFHVVPIGLGSSVDPVSSRCIKLGCLSLFIAKHLISKHPPHVSAFFTTGFDLNGLLGLPFVLHPLFDLLRKLVFL